jgi:SAM-dependent methyltransferase
LSATAKHWSTAKTIPRTRWWMHPAILRHINALVCGRPVDGPWAGLEQRMRELSPQGSFARGVSIGCGSASKELRLLRQGIVHHFDLFELSQERIAIGKAAAVRHGVADRVRFHVGDAFSLDLDDQYDLVYWNNALHHMFDVERALQWSRDRLRPADGW